MNLSMARRLIASAQSRAKAMGRPVSVAVVDAAGHLLAFERLEGAPLISVRLAQDKAYTAALMQMSTLDLGRLAAPGGQLFGIHVSHGGRIIIFGGGEPVGQGAIGVSGAAVAEDVEIARSAVSELTGNGGTFRWA